MNPILTFFFGLVGGFALTQAPLSGTFLASLEPLVDVIGLVAIVVFAATLIYKGIRAFFTSS